MYDEVTPTLEVVIGAARRWVDPDYHGAATVLGEERDNPDAYAAAVRIVNQALGLEDE